MYEHWGLPSPIMCPDERARARLAWRNERTMYRRKCDATGKVIISIFDQDAAFPVYDQNYWWSDAWSPLEYAREIDFSRPFFEQFVELFKLVPQCSLRSPQSENSEFTNQCEKNRDCYLIFCSNTSRQCMYGMWYQSCTDCLDCLYLEQSELCYEILNSKNCYRCTNSQNLLNCSECHFSRDLIGCRNCIGCVNLRNKEHFIFNEPYSPADWQAKVSQLGLDSFSGRSQLAMQFNEFAAQHPRKFYNGRNIEASTGDYLENCKNAIESFNCRNSENISYCRDAWSGRNSIDLTETLEQDFCIAIEGCYKTVDCGFSAKISETNNVWYSSHCFFGHNLFGCIGLKQGTYSILNKQYSKDEYFKLREKLVAHMQETGEWGQYFPMKDSPFAYNESVAQEYFPLSRAEVVKIGLRWKEEEVVDESGELSSSVGDRISQVSPDILEQVLCCHESGKVFKIQATELDFYRKMNLPIPREHHDVRHRNRMALRNPRRLNGLNCGECSKSLSSTYSVQDSVLCETCYLSAVS